MGKGLKYGLLGAVLGVAAVGLAPFELKKDEEGNLKYKSLLLGIEKGTNEDGECETTITFFNKPDMEKVSNAAGKVTEKVTEFAGTVTDKVKETATMITDKFKSGDDSVVLEFCDDDDAAEAIAEDLPQEDAPVEEAPAEDAE